ncbi:hypothetical protein R6Q57_010480 [Mikania cordata]
MCFRVDESKVIGREGDKEALLGSESSGSRTKNFNVVSVVGMGGIGKSTLAQYPRPELILPLALRILGRVFKGKSDEEWEELLSSEIWNSKNEREILPALMLSYYDHLKQMFAYCSLFPKGYMFDKNELVLLWMAEAFLYQPNERQTNGDFRL